MKQSIGGTYLIYFISIFILIVFAFLSGIMNYMKAFKVNSSIANALENHSGYNNHSISDIDNRLNTLGYRKAGNNRQCEPRNGIEATNTSSSHDICIYEIVETSSDCPTIIDEYVSGNSEVTTDEVSKCVGKFRYGIVTYIYLDLPIISEIRIPIYSESESIYLFEEWSKS